MSLYHIPSVMAELLVLMLLIMLMLTMWVEQRGHNLDVVVFVGHGCVACAHSSTANTKMLIL